MSARARLRVVVHRSAFRSSGAYTETRDAPGLLHSVADAAGHESAAVVGHLVVEVDERVVGRRLAGLERKDRVRVDHVADKRAEPLRIKKGQRSQTLMLAARNTPEGSSAAGSGPGGGYPRLP